MNTSNPGRLIVALLSLALFMAGCAASEPATIQTGENAEVTFDGLHKVNHSKADEAWARPDIDLSGYTKIMPIRTGIEYRMTTNTGTTATAISRGGPYFIDADTRVKFEALVKEVFLAELQKSKRFEIVNDSGPDVLMVSGALLDVASFVPQDSAGAINSRTYLRKVGEVTLVLELRDSETGTALARSVDHRAAENAGGSMKNSNTVSNTAEVRRLLTFWARRLREDLDEFAGPAAN
jgi:hypothetical protein